MIRSQVRRSVYIVCGLVGAQSMSRDVIELTSGGFGLWRWMDLLPVSRVSENIGSPDPPSERDHEAGNETGSDLSDAWHYRADVSLLMAHTRWVCAQCCWYDLNCRVALHQ